MSLQSLLSIARSALLTHQRAMSVTAHNVANAETPGYRRQRLEIVAADPEWGPFGAMGRGVTDQGVSHARASFYDATFRRGAGLLGNSTARQNVLTQIENAMSEPSDLGIAASLDRLFQSFSDLANDPTSPTIRDLVRSAGNRFVEQFHRLDSELQQSSDDALQQINEGVKSVNDLTRRIAELNTQIVATGGPNHSAPDLEDQRDALVDQLSGMINVKVTQHDDGTISVLAGNALLVDRGAAQKLEVRSPAGGGVALGVVTDNATLDPGSGSLDALLDLANTTIPGLRQQLDALAGALVFEVNNIHRQGFTANGATDVDFFASSGVTARTISLSAAVAGSSSNIAAGGTLAPGDGNNALRLAALSGNTISALGSHTFRDFYAGVAASVGNDLATANLDAETYQTLVDNADEQRQSITGVSTDEEMVNLISQQQAYSAAARLVKVADDMMQELLQMI